MRIKSIKNIGKQPVYNMTVDNTHNYLLDNGIASHNCDAVRYFAIYWTLSADRPEKEKKKQWRADQWEDYENATEEDKVILRKKWGEPA